jgi:hypothetical protein
MAIVINGKMNIPNVVAATTDIVGGKVAGSNPGNVIFFYDDASWKIVELDGTLAPYSLPVEATIAGDVTIGDIGINQSVAGSTTLSPLVGTQSVAVPGTAEPLAASSTKVLSVIIYTKSTNTNTVYIGNSIVDKTSSKQLIMPPGANVSIDAPLGFNINLNSWYVDAETAGEGVNWTALR